MQEKGTPFWQKFDEVHLAEMYTSLGGADFYEAYFDFPNYSTFDRISRDPEFDDVSEYFMTLVENVHRKVLTDERKIV